MSSPQTPSRGAILFAFAVIYVAWGTTYLAIKIGVRTERLPPLLFGGLRSCAAGILLLTFQRLRGRSLAITGSDFLRLSGVCFLLFVCGNGMVGMAMRSVDSGVGSVLGATNPLWLGLFAMFFPRDERLTARGWLGLFIGLAGVPILLAPKLENPAAFARDLGPLLALGAAMSWALGALTLRHTRLGIDHLTAAGYQMLIGGMGMNIVGVLIGEVQHLPQSITAGAIATFVYLLIVGSLMGYIAFNWLLGHVPATKVGTYAYVNPVVAVLIGWLLADEEMSLWIVGGIATILFGVFLVRTGERPAEIVEPIPEPEPVSA